MVFNIISISVCFEVLLFMILESKIHIRLYNNRIIVKGSEPLSVLALRLVMLL